MADVPMSCCKEQTANCGDGLAVEDGTSDKIYQDGCFDKAVDSIMDKGMIMGVCGIFFIVFEILNGVFALKLRAASS